MAVLHRRLFCETVVEGCVCALMRQCLNATPEGHLSHPVISQSAPLLDLMPPLFILNTHLVCTAVPIWFGLLGKMKSEPTMPLSQPWTCEALASAIVLYLYEILDPTFDTHM